MQFTINVHYFGRKLNVIADNNWNEIMMKKDKGVSQKDYSDWIGGFFNRKGEWYICLQEKPMLNEVVHEVVHFVNELFLFIGYQPKLDNDEIQAYFIGYFSEEIYKKIYNIKKIK